MSEEEIEYSYDLNFNKEDEYCIKHFGYNTFGDIEDLKLRQDKEHQIIQELQYRLEQRESQLDIANKKLNKIKGLVNKYG